MKRKNVIKAVGFIAVIIALYFVFSLFIVCDIDSMTRITFNDFYNTTDAEIYFVGPSHVYTGVNADDISAATGKKVFDLSSSLQEPSSSLLLLQEAFDINKNVEHVYIEVSPAVINGLDRSDALVYSVSDFVRNPVRKVRFILDRFTYDDYANSFFRLRRRFDPIEFPTLKTISKNIKGNFSADYHNYVPSTNNIAKYAGSGTWLRYGNLRKYGVVLFEKSKKLDNLTIDDIDVSRMEDYRKCVELCHENGVDVTFYVTAYSQPYLYSFKHFQDYCDYIRDFAYENGCDYFNLSFAKDEYLDIEDADFDDQDHLNSDGSDKLTKFFTTYMENPDGDYFYDTYAECEKYDDIIAIMYELNYRAANGTEGDNLVMEDCGYPIDEFMVKFYTLPDKDKKYRYSMFYYDVDDVDFSDRVELEYTDLDRGVVGEEVIPEETEDGQVFRLPYTDFYRYFQINVYDADTNELVYRAYSDIENK